VIQQLRKSLKLLKRVAKWKNRHRKILKNVNERIERKKREAEERRRKEE
jgi:hypothetical protein